MTTSKLLRSKTADLHQAAEQALNVAGIRDSSLSLEAYTRMIRAHHQVWAAVGRWLPAAVPARDRTFVNQMQAALEADLLKLGAATPPPVDLALTDTAQAAFLGVLYVLRGSTLGGTLIDRKLRECPELSHLTKFNFHGACTALPPRHWPEFIAGLDNNTGAEADQAKALAAARAGFGLYLD